jgi:glutamate/tyrosine decarboxylase-like PLP-dependent enzyme
MRTPAAMSYTAAYLTGQGQGRAGLRAPGDYVLESSRRARGFTTWAALRQLGRSGVAELVERCCALARRFADRLGEVDGATVANDIVLNQVLVGSGTTSEPTAWSTSCSDRASAGWRHDVARPTAHAHLGVELADDRSRCRSLGGCDQRGDGGRGIGAKVAPAAAMTAA